MKIAFSPCPNDTFVFHAWTQGLIKGAPKLEVTYADIDKTNHWAINGEGPEVMKISFAALPYILDRYMLLSCGGALGRGCGPLVLSKEAGLSANDLAGKKVAVPSDKSTAYMLFRLWMRQNLNGELPEIEIMPFEKIMPAVRDGEIDAGLVIHEARFTYPDFGLALITDLGEWWEKDTGSPIPLGAIVAKRELSREPIEEAIKASLQYGYDHREASRSFIMEHAQEMSEEVADSHIALYVNEFTAELGEEGYLAIESLLLRAADEGLVPPIRKELLRK